MWLGSTTLASLLLVCSLTAAAPGQTAQATTITRSSMKPVLVASSVTPSGTYTEVVRKQMQWISKPAIPEGMTETDSESEKTIPPPNATVTVAAQKQQPSEPAPAPKAESQTKPIQVVASSKQQVSRSDNSTLLNNALSLVGTPYAYGGSSRSGFDCSGFTQYVFKGSEISLPRTSVSQFNVGSTIPREKLQAGDLVFFTTYADGPSHVGIYVGGGSFVHASNTGVRTTSLNESYYEGRYLGARRVE